MVLPVDTSLFPKLPRITSFQSKEIREILRPARHSTCLGATTPKGRGAAREQLSLLNTVVFAFVSSISSHPKSKVIIHQVSIAGFQTCFFSTIRVMVVHGMFLLSCRIKIVGNICDRQRFLIDTLFVLFRSSRVDTQG